MWTVCETQILQHTFLYSHIYASKIFGNLQNRYRAWNRKYIGNLINQMVNDDWYTAEHSKYEPSMKPKTSGIYFVMEFALL